MTVIESGKQLQEVLPGMLQMAMHILIKRPFVKHHNHPEKDWPTIELEVDENQQITNVVIKNS